VNLILNNKLMKQIFSKDVPKNKAVQI